MKKYELGLSSCGKTLNDKLFSDYKANGITKIELSKNDYSSTDFDELLALSQKYGVKLWSLHLPFMPFDKIDISSLNEDLRKSSVDLCKLLVAQANKVGINLFIVHPSGEPVSDEYRKDKLAQAKKSLKELAEFASKYNSTIAVEDLPRTCLGNSSKEILDLISVDDRLKVCFDTNHLLGEDLDDFIKRVGDKIVTLHVSDFDFVNERHWLPGEGKIDWHKLLRSLEKINYQGPWLYEIGFGIPKTILRDRELNCSDFAINAKELFNNEKLTVISKQKPNLGMWE